MILKFKQIQEASSNVPSKLLLLLDEFNCVCPDEFAAKLPPMRDIQHKIDLIPSSNIPHLPHYKMSPCEHDILQQIVDYLLEKKLIKPSLNPCVVPALLVLKKDRSWRMCVDSRVVNKIMIKYSCSIPRLEDLFDKLYGVQLFSRLDLKKGYHQIRIYLEDDWKIAFKSGKGCN